MRALRLGIKVWFGLTLIFGVGSSPAPAAFEIRPDRLGGSPLVPLLQPAPFTARTAQGNDSTGRWTLGVLHLVPHGIYELRYDHVGLTSPEGRVGLRMSQLDAKEYHEWSTQVSVEAIPGFVLAANGLWSQVDPVQARESGLESRFASTLSGACRQELHPRVELTCVADDFLRLGEVDALGLRGAYGVSVRVLAGLGLTVAFQREWVRAANAESRCAAEWRIHSNLALGTEWRARGDAPSSWIGIDLDRASARVWMSQADGLDPTVGIALTLRPGPAAKTARSNEVSGTATENVAGPGPPLPLEPRPSEDDAWADSLHVLADSLERETGMGPSRSDFLGPFLWEHREDDGEGAPALLRDAGRPEPLSRATLRADDVRRLLGVSDSLAEAIAAEAIRPRAMRSLSLGPPGGAMRDLAPYLTDEIEEPARLAIPAAMAAESLSSWAARIERGYRRDDRTGRSRDRVFWSGEVAHSRMDLSARIDGSSKLAWIGGGWSHQSTRLGAGRGFALPLPARPWTGGAAPRRSEGSAAWWIETAPGRWQLRGGLDARASWFSVGYRGATWIHGVSFDADHRAQAWIGRSAPELSCVLQLRRLREHAWLGAVHARWSAQSFRLEASEERSLAGSRTIVPLSSYEALRTRRRFSASLRARSVSIAVRHEWKLARSEPLFHASSVDARQWRLETRVRRPSFAAEVRASVSRTDRRPASPRVFVLAPPRRSVTSSGRGLVTVPLGNARRVGLELGLERRDGRARSIGRWTGAWVEQSRGRWSWSAGALEVRPGRTSLSLSPSWASGRRSFRGAGLVPAFSIHYAQNPLAIDLTASLPVSAVDVSVLEARVVWTVQSSPRAHSP